MNHESVCASLVIAFALGCGPADSEDARPVDTEDVPVVDAGAGGHAGAATGSGGHGGGAGTGGHANAATGGSTGSAAAPSDAGAGVLETLMIGAANGNPVSSHLVTVVGVTYTLRAAGSVFLGGGCGGLGDAEYADFDATGNGCIIDQESGTDFGVAIDEDCVSPRTRKWGPYRKDHVYTQTFAGDGKAIELRYCDMVYLDNKAGDRLTLQILATP